MTNGGVYAVSLDAPPAYAGPTHAAVTAGTASAAAITGFSLTTIRGVGRRMFLAVMTANQTMATPSGWNLFVPDSGTPSRGTAGAAGGVKMTVFWRDSDTTETTVDFADSGDIQYVVGYSVAKASGASGIDFAASIAGNAASSASGVFSGPTTPVDDCFVIVFEAHDRDAAGSFWSAQANASLANVTERFDNATSTGTGGGVLIITGEKQAAGAVGNTTATQSTASAYAWITIALKNASGATAITPANTAHTHTASSPTLAAKSTVAPNSAANVHTATSPSIAAKSTIASSSAAHLNVASSPSIAAQSTVAPDSAAHIVTSTETTVGTPVAITPADAAHITASSEPALAAKSAVTANGSAHVNSASSPTLATNNTVIADSAAHIATSSQPTIAATSSVAPDSVNHATASTSPVLAAVYPITPYSTVHDVASTQPGITLAGAIAPDGAAHDTAASSPTVSAHSSIAVESAAHSVASSTPGLSGSVTIAPASVFHGQSASSPSVAWTGQVAANDAGHETAATLPSVTAGASINPDSTDHDQSASSPTLNTDSTVSAESSAHIVVAGVPTIRITMPASTSRTITAGYLDRAGETMTVDRSSSTQPIPRNQVTAVGSRDVKSVRFAR
jgi:hypothetical protein